MKTPRTLANDATRPSHATRPSAATRPSVATRRRLRLAIPAVAVLAAAGVFAACNPSGSGPLSSGRLSSLSLSSFAVPSLNIPSMNLPSLGAAATGTTCVGPVAAGILNQLEISGSGDIQGKLQQNRDALISGLQSWQPEDSARATWRDQLVTALQSNDYAGAAAKIQQLSSGEVVLTTC
jgi:hypothetical protein